LYSPPKTVAYHLWERAYRRTYKEDHAGNEAKRTRQLECIARIKEIVLGDKAFVEEMMRRGVDLVNKEYTEDASNGGIDSSFYNI
jgi:hypothetical protein